MIDQAELVEAQMLAAYGIDGRNADYASEVVGRHISEVSLLQYENNRIIGKMTSVDVKNLGLEKALGRLQKLVAAQGELIEEHAKSWQIYPPSLRIRQLRTRISDLKEGV